MATTRGVDVTMKPESLRIVRTSPGRDAPNTETDPARPDAEVSSALRELITRFDAFIRRTASRHGLRGSDLDEVVQDLHLRIWKSFGTSELIRRARPSYVYRAAVSASLDIIRRRRTLKSRAARLDDVPATHLGDGAPGIEEQLAAGDLARVVHESLAQLHESRRAVVRMYLAGYDRFEIAELMGWTEAKTRNLLYRGLADLRAVLAARGITRESI